MRLLSYLHFVMYYTPTHILDLLRDDLRGRRFADLCSDDLANLRVKADKFYDNYSEALAKDLLGYSLFANPPYKPGFLPPFVRYYWSLVNELQSPYILLVNTSTDTAWFQTSLDMTEYCVFIKGRLSFWDSELNYHSPGNRYSTTIFFGGDVEFKGLRSLGYVINGGAKIIKARG